MGAAELLHQRRWTIQKQPAERQLRGCPMTAVTEFNLTLSCTGKRRSGRGFRSVVKVDWTGGRYLAGVETTSIGAWSLVMSSSILDTNFGVRPFTIFRMPGPNS